MQIPFAGLTSRRGAASSSYTTTNYANAHFIILNSHTDKKRTVMKIVAINSIHKSSRRHHKGALFRLVEFKTNI